MLYHTDIVYAAEGLDELYSELAVKIHGAVMRLIPTEYAAELHRNTLQPFSLFCMEASDRRCVMLRFSALTKKAQSIASALAQQEKLIIYGLKKPLLQIECQSTAPISADVLLGSEIPNGYRLQFLSPAVFRRSGKSHCTPVLARFLRSVTEKLNEFESLCIDADSLLDYVGSIPMDSYRLSGQKYNISGSVYNGMTGWADIVFPDKTTENARILNAVLRYAEYSGVGAKTAVGMGGISIEPI